MLKNRISSFLNHSELGMNTCLAEKWRQVVILKRFFWFKFRTRVRVRCSV